MKGSQNGVLLLDVADDLPGWRLDHDLVGARVAASRAPAAARTALEIP